MNFKIKVTNELLIELALKMRFDLEGWQKRWSQNQFHRDRVLNKGRQIGASWYFALEALNDACLTGRNKIFIGDITNIKHEIEYLCYHTNLSHSDILVSYFEENKRLVISLSNGAKIYFISSENILVAAITGDVYIPEWSWNKKPNYILDLVSGITTHHKWRRTFYSSRAEYDNASKNDIKIKNSRNGFFERVNTLQSMCFFGRSRECMKELLIYQSKEFQPERFAEMFLCVFSGD